MWHGLTIKNVRYGYGKGEGKLTFVEFTDLEEPGKTFMVRFEGHRERGYRLEHDVARKHESKPVRMDRRDRT